MAKERSRINREYKDRLFKLIFKEKKDLLELYNAVNNTSYSNPEEVEINSIEDAIYMGMKNDISFLVKNVLNLYEHQSTFSPNLPLRGLLYFADLYRKIIGSGKDLYSSKRISLPYPSFIVFYNGTKKEPERQILELHGAFPEGFAQQDAALQCRALVLNINLGCNQALMEKCHRLKEYAQFISKVRKFLDAGEAIQDAVNLAVDSCIVKNILADILKNHREEVCSMLLYEYDEQAHIENEREIAREEGGTLKLIAQIGRKYQKGKSLTQIAEDLEENESDIEELYHLIENHPGKQPKDILSMLDS